MTDIILQSKLNIRMRDGDRSSRQSSRWSWRTCKKQKKCQQEKRLDIDGRPYPWSEFKSYYGDNATGIWERSFVYITFQIFYVAGNMICIQKFDSHYK